VRLDQLIAMPTTHGPETPTRRPTTRRCSIGAPTSEPKAEQTATSRRTRNGRSSAKRIQEKKENQNSGAPVVRTARRAYARATPHRATRRPLFQKGRINPTISSSRAPTAREMPSRKHEDETVLDRRTDERAARRQRRGPRAQTSAGRRRSRSLHLILSNNVLALIAISDMTSAL
jgi:hypothetical protein